MKTYKERYDFVLESTSNLLKMHEKNISRDNRFLIELGMKIFAYQSAATVQEQEDFKSRIKHDYEEYDSIEDIIKNESIYDKDELMRIAKRVQKSCKQSSIENKDSMKRLKKLLTETKITQLYPKYEGLSDDTLKLISCAGPSLEEQYKKRNEKLRKAAALKIKNELQLQDKDIVKLHKIAFDQIIFMVNMQKTTELSSDKLKTLKFIERCINQYFSSFRQDLGLNIKVQRLIDLRKDSTKNYNSACYECGRLLLRRNNNHYCTKQENRECYEKSRKEMKKNAFPECLSRTKNKCENCGQRSSMNFIHKIERIQRQFCSQKCYETFRKRTQRKHQN